MKNRTLCVAIAFAVVVLVRSADAATLYGDTVTAKMTFDLIPDVTRFEGSAVVGAGTEFVSEYTPNFINEVDFGETSLTIRYVHRLGGGLFAPKHWAFTGLDWLAPPSQLVNVVPAVGNPTGVTISDVGLHSFVIGLPEITTTSPTVSWSFELISAPVPEPSSLTLFGVMASAILLNRRWRRPQI